MIEGGAAKPAAFPSIIARVGRFSAVRGVPPWPYLARSVSREQPAPARHAMRTASSGWIAEPALVLQSLDVSERRRRRDQASSSRLAITCAWISAAPSKMLRMRASQSTRLIGYSIA